MAKPLKVQIIERAKELIQDESHWCRGYLAVDADGNSVDPTGSEAVKRCALGALLAAAYQLTTAKRNPASWLPTRYAHCAEATRLCLSTITRAMLQSWQFSMKQYRPYEPLRSEESTMKGCC